MIFAAYTADTVQRTNATDKANKALPGRRGKQDAQGKRNRQDERNRQGEERKITWRSKQRKFPQF